MQENTNQTTEKKPRKLRATRPSKLHRITFEALEFAGKWLKLIGKPAPNFFAIIYGVPKSGKSTLTLDFANYLTQFGKVLYVAAEEAGTSLACPIAKTLRDRCERLGVNTDDIILLGETDIKPIEAAMARYPTQFVVIDSAHAIHLTPHILRSRWRKKYPKRAFICIMQANKSGDIHGSMEWKHDAEIMIFCDNGHATQSGRYNEGGEMPIFPTKQKPNLFNI